MRRLLVALVMLVAVVVGAIAFVPPVRTSARTVGLLAELMDLPVRPLSAVTPTPGVVHLSYGAVQPDSLDIYLPADAGASPVPALVLTLGVHPPPLDHPDIVRVAQGIARLGVVVGVPDSTALRETRVTADEPGHLAEAWLVVAGLREVDPDRVGLAGFSAGASVALVASADPRIAGRVAYVSAFGGFADAETLLVDIATRSAELDGAIRPWAPEPAIRRDVAALLLNAMVSSPQRDRLQALLDPIIEADGPPPGPDPGVLAALTDPDVRAAYRLFIATSRADAWAAISTASDRVRGPLAAISPLAVAGRIRAPVFLLHGETDTSIPVEHARAIAERLPAGVLHRLTIFQLFRHEQPGKHGIGLDELPDVLELYRYLHDIVATATE